MLENIILILLLVGLAALTVGLSVAAVLGRTRTRRRDGTERAGEPEELDPNAAARRAGGSSAWMRFGGSG